MRLGLAQPPLSAAIGKLERKLGAQLLERTSRRVTLTPAGAVLLEQGRIAVEGVGAAIERARRAGTQADRLTVAVKPGTGTDLLKQIMQRLPRIRGCRRCTSCSATQADLPPRSAVAPPTSRSCAPRSTSAAWTPNCC
jgi:DNA-binding transcriptional LysR family regulator